jgi:lipoyl(octanoyl) transferase
MLLRKLGTVPYAQTWQAMREFTDTRDSNSDDELWLLQHPAVFTQGQAGRAEHLLNPGDIPIIQSDRGGQVTYHGPGQWVVYLLVDLRRAGVGVRDLVDLIEHSVVACLQGLGIEGVPRRDAPGVYVGGAKIAQLGLRVRRGCSYHGVALNVDMDLEPFARINPCGFQDLPVTSVRECLAAGSPLDADAIAEDLLAQLQLRLLAGKE